jgi:quercetin dioxygenase-like cupin family protein
MKKVHLHGEQTAGAVSVIESEMPAQAPGPRLHHHDFAEAFYVLDGEITVQLRDELDTFGAGELAFAPGGVAHTLANRTDAPARFLIICTPAGFERNFEGAARADPPPEVTYVGPRIPGATGSR